MNKEWSKYVIPSIAVTMIGVGSTTASVSADSDDHKPKQQQENNVTKQVSKEIALDRIPGTIEEVELDNEDGYIVYEVELQSEDDDEYEVIINAQTGDILEIESDDNDNDDDDDNDD
ncbi:PepSY domain-containing protein [Oceanobacillus rekensis]|uniref:PepSY domain-containing protein n=1 Tax=Oceanobacillus rekensis TaxID=937927 RepID=UPI000B453169|nr:PepSY domain-containing protein [Oceanobacillus rekensis]